ncbi:MAG: alpha/beta hydrolase [Chloroflexales bacterium]
MITHYYIHHKQSNRRLIARRDVMKFGLYGAVSLTAEALISACGTAVPQPTTTPGPTDTPPSPVAPTATPPSSVAPTVPPDTHFIKTKDGRKLSCIEAGQADGIPVLVFTGTPMSRILYQGWVDDAISKGLRLICYDRPGYGGSTPKPGRTVANATEDVSDLAKALGLNKLLVWGVSGGGPHSIACAALLPDLVVAAAALASPAPYVPFTAEGNDWTAGMSSDNVSEYQTALKGRDALKEYVEGVHRTLGCSPNPQSVTSASQGVFDYLMDSMCLALQKGPDGWIDDDLASLAQWGLEPNQIRIPFFLMQGKKDNLVPISNGLWLAKNIPNVETRFIPDEDHLGMFNHIPEIHQWLLSKWK